MIRRGLLALVLSLMPHESWAADWYVAPLDAAPVAQPDGSEARPFPSTDAALASGKVRGGDTVFLMDGVHGMLKVEAAFPAPVTFMSQHGRKARVDYVFLNKPARNVIIRDLSVWPTDPHQRHGEYVGVTDGTSDIRLLNLDIRSGQDAYRYPTWSAGEWLARAADGIVSYGDRTEARGNRLTGVKFGIVIAGRQGVVVANTIDGFSADGLRGGGDGGVFTDNLVQNCVSVDENHADGFQSYAGQGAVVTGLTLRRNRILEWTRDPNHPLRCGLQGIAMFDGIYQDITIENNVIALRNGHGISIYGARRARITHNTVVNITGNQPGYPWIMIAPAKDGTPAADVLVANNLAMAYSGKPDPAHRLAYVANQTIRSVALTFPDWWRFNYTPARYADLADPAFAPPEDALRHQRPAGGAGADPGAIEAGAVALFPDLPAPPPPLGPNGD